MVSTNVNAVLRDVSQVQNEGVGEVPAVVDPSNIEIAKHMPNDHTSPFQEGRSARRALGAVDGRRGALSEVKLVSSARTSSRAGVHVYKTTRVVLPWACAFLAPCAGSPNPPPRPGAARSPRAVPATSERARLRVEIRTWEYTRGQPASKQDAVRVGGAPKTGGASVHPSTVFCFLLVRDARARSTRWPQRLRMEVAKKLWWSPMRHVAVLAAASRSRPCRAFNHPLRRAARALLPRHPSPVATTPPHPTSFCPPCIGSRRRRLWLPPLPNPSGCPPSPPPGEGSPTRPPAVVGGRQCLAVAGLPSGSTAWPLTAVPPRQLPPPMPPPPPWPPLPPTALPAARWSQRRQTAGALALARLVMSPLCGRHPPPPPLVASRHPPRPSPSPAPSPSAPARHPAGGRGGTYRRRRRQRRSAPRGLRLRRRRGHYPAAAGQTGGPPQEAAAPAAAQPTPPPPPPGRTGLRTRQRQHG